MDLDFKGLGIVLIMLAVIVGAVFFIVGGTVTYLFTKPQYDEVIYKEVIISDTTHLDDGRMLIMQHKEFKKIIE